MVLTLANNLSKDWSTASLKALLSDLTRIVKEEEYRRGELQKAGLRFGVVSTSKLLPNNLCRMDNSSLDYDEKRVCFNCRHICFMSAVACECNKFNVACLREAIALCNCKMQKRYLMAWHEIDELWEMVRKVEDFIERSTTSWNKPAFMKPEEEKRDLSSTMTEECGIKCDTKEVQEANKEAGSSSESIGEIKMEEQGGGEKDKAKEEEPEQKKNLADEIDAQEAES